MFDIKIVLRFKTVRLAGFRTLGVIMLLFFVSAVFAQQSLIISGLELPAITKQDVVIKHLGYTLSYNEKHEQANWIAYLLTADEILKAVSRTDNFRPDAAVRTGSAGNQDYQGSGYDRGHLAPAADMCWSRQAMDESFFYSNMSPQDQGFNRGIWKQLETQVRKWAVDNQAIYVVTGPILTANLKFIGPNHVSVPRYYYKVLLDFTRPGLKGIGFILPNASSSLSLQQFAVPIDSIEQVTGIDFFPALPDDLEMNLEKTFCPECWSWTSTRTRTAPSRNSALKTNRCTAITQAGNRCKRMTSNASGQCTQHQKL